MINGGLRTKEPISYDNNKPIISVITVVYNGVSTIEKTIQSVINQTYKNIEYIIVDGESTDGTIDIIRRYEDKIAYWQSEPDKGIYDAMNKGIELANGDWINFMNAGDKFVSNEVISFIMEKCRYESDERILYGDVILSWMNKYKYQKVKKLEFIKREMPFCHQSTFISTELMKSEKYNLQYKVCADYDLFLKSFLNGVRFHYLGIPIAIFDCSGTTSDIDKLLKDLNEILDSYNLEHIVGTGFVYNVKKVLKRLLPQNIRNRVISSSIKGWKTEMDFDVLVPMQKSGCNSVIGGGGIIM